MEIKNVNTYYVISDPIWGSTMNFDSGVKFKTNLNGQVLAYKAGTWHLIRKHTLSFINICDEDVIPYGMGYASEFDIIMAALSSGNNIDIKDDVFGTISCELLSADYGHKQDGHNSKSITIELLEVL